MAEAPRVLLTGSSGGVGRVAQSVLAGAGWDVRPFDLAQGQDLRNPQSVLAAIRGCVAVVHAGALAHDTAGTPVDIVTTNVLSTWHVLAAAEQHGLSCVVYFSSAQVFGFAEGEGTPAYLPVDDDHPVRASRPYGMSKRLAEEMCQAWTTRTGIPTIVLRPVLILDDQGRAVLRRLRCPRSPDPAGRLHGNFPGDDRHNTDYEGPHAGKHPQANRCR